MMKLVAVMGLALTTLAPVRAMAQGDSAARAMLLEAAAKVKRVRLVPATVKVAVADTAEFTIEFLDEGGRPVLVKLPGGPTIMPPYAIVAPELLIVDRGETGGRLKVVGLKPSSTAPVVRILLSEADGTGQSRFQDLPVALSVVPRPTDRVAVSEAPNQPYAGTMLTLTASVWTKGSTYPETDPVVTWTSSNPSVATILGPGIVSFTKSGPVSIVAAHGGVRTAREFTVRANPAARLTVSADRAEARTGDVVRLRAQVVDRSGKTVDDVKVNYAVNAAGSINQPAGAVVYEDGAFVAERPGAYTVVAETGGVSDRITVLVRPRDDAMEARLVNHSPLPAFGTSEVMVFEGKDGRDYAYLGTWGNGDRVYIYDVTNPAAPVVTDSVLVDARVINDIRVDTEKGPSIAVFTREAAASRKNGIVILDVSAPAHPKVLSEYTETVANGVHDVWIYKNRVYLTNDGTGDMHIIDITDPKNPKESGRWSTGTPGRYIHDLIFENDIGYLSYWDDGMIILDVGGAGKGGTLDRPAFVSQFKYGPYGSTHHIFRYKNYVFISDELFGPNGGNADGPGGYVHVVDVSDLEHPKEVARFEVPEAGAHNTWAEDDKLYVAHYQGGLRVVDISGELRGDLYQQGRQVAVYKTAGGRGRAHVPNAAMAWSAQPYKGNIFVSDLNSGMWVIRLEPRARPIP